MIGPAEYAKDEKASMYWQSCGRESSEDKTKAKGNDGETSTSQGNEGCRSLSLSLSATGGGRVTVSEI